MLARIRDRNILVVYTTIFLLGVAYGSSLAVTPLQLDAVGFSKTEIGTLASWFAGGIVAMSIPAGVFIRRFSAKRTLLVCLCAYVVAVGLFPFQTTYPGACAVRTLDGASSVGAWVCCETILLARSDDDNKAYVTSLYAMAIAIGYVVGSLLARGITQITGTSYMAVFLVASAITVVAIAFTAARLDPDRGGGAADAPHHEHAAGGSHHSSATILWRIKTSCLATFSYGYFQASVVLFLPLYLIGEKHVPERSTILMTAFFAGGMLLFSNIAGRLGDRVGHLRVMTALALVGIVMTLGFVALDSWPVMCAAIFVTGATLASISPVSLALQGIVCEPADYSRGNAIYNACYALGMLVGPPISSFIFKRVSGVAMIYHFSALWAGFVVFCVIFRKDDPASRHRAPAPG